MDKQKVKKRAEKTSYYFVLNDGGIIPAGKFANTIHYLALHIIREFTSSYLQNIDSDVKFSRRGKLIMIEDILARQQSGKFNIDNCSLVVAKYIMSYFTVVKTDEHKPLSNREIRMLEFVIKKDIDMVIEEVKILEDE